MAFLEGELRVEDWTLQPCILLSNSGLSDGNLVQEIATSSGSRLEPSVRKRLSTRLS